MLENHLQKNNWIYKYVIVQERKMDIVNTDQASLQYPSFLCYVNKFMYKPDIQRLVLEVGNEQNI